ncbi:PTS glucose transporter subunit IIA [Mycoplasmopsis columboralis]|uniref:PTS system, glucose/glucosamine/beta-glucoside-specific, IICBA component n=1 Tax=Mycoplasmopsis columboralis TaxID=171282 RepID=A0A449B6F2_9BACT|nr:PTS glucose transporter subunit IIA [Mycoplasmopsis columboralis]VEU76183.1 PTS system, glucose/glucosamine/beta-glucoside-specific, IICBA component [Mycoplasmopsis columboralis]
MSTQQSLSEINKEYAKKIVDAFGGINNITGFNNCISRLRYDVKNVTLVNVETLKNLGAADVFVYEDQKHVQAVFGIKAEGLNQEIKKHVAEWREAECNQDPLCVEEKHEEQLDAFDKKTLTEVQLIAPLNGEIKKLQELNDGILSEGLAGEGFVLEHQETSKVTLLAPFTGTLTMMPAFQNQMILKSPNGLEVLMVFGLDSYKINGIGFKSHLSLNKAVSKGDNLIDIDFEVLKKENLDTRIAFIVTSDSKLKNFKVSPKTVKMGETFMVIKK